MWIEDVTKALWMLGDIRYIDCITKIENNIIYMSSGSTYLVKDLVADYDKEYGG